MKKETIVCIITGPSGVGKSTIAKALAENIKRSAYLPADDMRHMIKNGYANPFTYKGEAKRQIDLNIKNACLLANNFMEAGFNVFIDDVLEEEQNFKNYIKYLRKKPKIFLLLPNKRVLVERDMQRKEEDQMGERALELHNIFLKNKNKRKWHILDTSNHTIEQTKKEILKIIRKKA